MDRTETVQEGRSAKAGKLHKPLPTGYNRSMKPITREWLGIAAEDLDAGQAMLDSGRYLYAAMKRLVFSHIRRVKRQ